MITGALDREIRTATFIRVRPRETASRPAAELTAREWPGLSWHSLNVRIE
jgi:hypothetical protein